MTEPHIPEPLRRIAKQVADGERPNSNVRTILSWYNYRIRSRYVVQTISRDMTYLKIGTVPHIDWTYLDGVVTFMPREEAVSQEPAAYELEHVSRERTFPAPTMAFEVDSSHAIDAVGQPENPPPDVPFDPTYRIGRLEMANRRPISIAPDAPVSEAITVMLKHDYSQLPVMTGERSVKGLSSWKSYGSRRSLGQACVYVREAMDDSHKVGVNDSIFSVVARMRDYDCVLVEDKSGVITGIITPYDISVTFGQLGEPFLVLGEIENHIRRLIEGKFTRDELAEARNPLDEGRVVEAVSDLTFGEYVRLLENSDRWNKLGLALDRATFVRDLEEVREIRNDVMHFDPEGIDSNDLKKLRDFAGFLQRVQKLRTST
jgi:CBS domain-containing protein